MSNGFVERNAESVKNSTIGSLANERYSARMSIPYRRKLSTDKIWHRGARAEAPPTTAVRFEVIPVVMKRLQTREYDGGLPVLGKTRPTGCIVLPVRRYDNSRRCWFESNPDPFGWSGSLMRFGIERLDDGYNSPTSTLV